MVTTLTAPQQTALALIPKFSALLSMLGSLWIICDISTNKRKLKTVRHRILLGLSCVDTTTSFSLFLSTWPIPRETPGIVWNVGNEASCRFQGFFIQLGSAAYVYNAVLTIYYVLVVRFSVNDERLFKYNWMFHVVPLTFGFGTAMVSLVLDFYANANLWCFLAGNQAYIFRWIFYYGPLWFCFLVISIGMFMVYWGVYRTERESAKFDGHHLFREATRSNNNGNDSDAGAARQVLRERKSATKSAKRTGQVGAQALSYSELLNTGDSPLSLSVAVFFMTYFFSTVDRTYQQVKKESIFGLLLMQVLFAPLQGTFNFIVYRRPFLLKVRKDHPDWSWHQVIYKSVVIPYFVEHFRRSSTGSNAKVSAGATSSMRQSVTSLRNQSSAQDEVISVQDDADNVDGHEMGKYDLERHKEEH